MQKQWLFILGLLLFSSTALAQDNTLTNGQALTDTPLSADLAADESAQVFTFNTNPETNTTVAVSAITPDFNFAAIVREASGEIVAQVIEGAAFSYTLLPGDSTYTVEISAADPTTSGRVSIGLVAQAETDACMVSAQGGAAVNVRSGPGTNFEAVAQLESGTRVAVTGINGTWYQVEMPDVGPGWVRRDVVVGFGGCENVPQVDEAQPADVTVTSTPLAATATFTPLPSTATFTPSPAAPMQPTLTFTPSGFGQPTSTFGPTRTFAPPTPTITVTVAGG